MIKAIVSDFSRVLLFPKDRNYLNGLNPLHKELSRKPGYNALDQIKEALNSEVFFEGLKLKC